ncbi:MAG: sensor histidine kinase [Polaribacter sp.]
MEQSRGLKNDSISLWITSSKNSSFSLEKRKPYLKKAYTTLKSYKLDTFSTWTLSKITYQSFKLKDTLDVKHNLFEPLIIRDSINSKGGSIVIHKIHLSVYYATIQDTVKAINFAKEANLLSKKIKNNQGYLASLKLLSKLDKKRAKGYLESYITYEDSLYTADRKIQNKFKTDKYIEENKLLSQQKIRILIIIIPIVLFILLLIYYIVVRRSKNKRLVLEIEQQKASEQIYVLTRKQQTKLEEEKAKERNRISQELHDGVLGKLFGIRMNLGFLELKGDDDTLQKYELFLDELQDAEVEIRGVSHQLNANFNSSEIDFSSILERFLENKSRLGNFTCQLNIEQNVAWSAISEIIKANLYRILQEALQNIIKYANAKDVVLDFSVEKNNLIINIKDNGIGFNVTKQKKGIGIKNMKSRTQKLKGVCSIQSKIGKGTSIHFTIPIP